LFLPECIPHTGLGKISRLLLCRQRVAGNRTRRQIVHGIDGISATVGTDGEDAVLEIRQHILGCGRVGGGLVFIERPLRLGHLDLVQVGNTSIGIGRLRRLLLLSLELLQMFLLKFEGRARGGEMLGVLAVLGLGMVQILLERIDLLGQQVVLLAQAGDLVELLAGAGILQRGELRLSLVQLPLRVAQIGLRLIASVIGAKEEDFRDEHQGEAQPGEPAFGIHGGAFVAVFRRGVNAEFLRCGWECAKVHATTQRHKAGTGTSNIQPRTTNIQWLHIADDIG